jgi:hypothetical protein
MAAIDTTDTATADRGRRGDIVGGTFATSASKAHVLSVVDGGDPS